MYLGCDVNSINASTYSIRYRPYQIFSDHRLIVSSHLISRLHHAFISSSSMTLFSGHASGGPCQSVVPPHCSCPIQPKYSSHHHHHHHGWEERLAHVGGNLSPIKVIDCIVHRGRILLVVILVFLALRRRPRPQSNTFVWVQSNGLFSRGTKGCH